jgi:ABC-2 type transport system permease protein
MTATAVRSSVERDVAAVASLERNVRTAGMVWLREILRFRRSGTRIVTSLAQPFLFLLVFGVGLSPLLRQQATGGFEYKKFLWPGVVAMSVLFTSAFSAISIVWDREFGFLREMLVAPVSRTSLVVGKALGGGTVSVVQATIILVAAPVVGVHLTPLLVIELLGLMILLAFGLTAFGIVMASRMQRIESFQVVMSLVIQPMFFLSGAIFPLSNLPGWLAVLTRLNPMTYAVDPMRRVVNATSRLPTGAPATGLRFGSWVMPIWTEVLIVAALGSAMLAIAVGSFRKVE